MAKIRMQEIMEDYLPVIYSNSIKFDPLVNVDYTETLERDIDGTSENLGTSNSSSQNTGSVNSTSEDSGTASSSAENSGTSNSTSSSNSSGLNVSSDTPQGQISKQAILNGAYASTTNASETESEIEDNTTTSNNSSSESETTNSSTTESNTSNSSSSTETSKNNGTTSSKETYTKNIKGNSGVSATAQALIKQYRDVIRAVDREIINDLNVLFMGIY